MIGHEFTYGDIALHDIGKIEVVECDKISNELVFYDAAHRPSRYKDKYTTLKEVTVSLRVIEKTSDRRNLEEVTDSIVLSLYGQEPVIINWNGKYCEGIFSHVANSEYQWKAGYLELVFYNLNGLWLTEETTVSIGESIEISGNMDTNYITAEVQPTAETVELIIGGKTLKLEGAITQAPLLIDFNKKTAKQNDKHVFVHVEYDYFKLEKGTYTTSITGGTGTISYREVKAL